jgi:hypothetical protein
MTQPELPGLVTEDFRAQWKITAFTAPYRKVTETRGLMVAPYRI